jgi:hypothetical protein
MSNIDSFTPSNSLLHHPRSRIVVPASFDSPIPSNHRNHPTSSGNMRAPPNLSSISTTEKSPHQSTHPSVSIPSSDSSHRPLFTPEQPISTSRVSASASAPLKTYGKQQVLQSQSPLKLDTPIQSAIQSARQVGRILLSPSTSEENEMPNPPIIKKRKTVPVTDDEEEEIIERPLSPAQATPVEHQRQPGSSMKTPSAKPRSSVEVVLPSRGSEGAKSTRAHYSPDPLALVDKSPNRTKTAKNDKNAKASSSKAASGSSRSKPSGSAASASTRRISSRQQDAQDRAEKAREEAHRAQLERREKRRLAQEEALRSGVNNEGDDTHGRRSSTRGTSGIRRGTSEVVDKGRHAEEADKSANRDEEEEDEVIILDDIPTPIVPKHASPVKAVTTNITEKAKGKKRKGMDEDDEDEFDDLESVTRSDNEDFVPEKRGKKEKAKATPKVKAVKGKKGKVVKEVAKPIEVEMEKEDMEERVDEVMESLDNAVVIPETSAPVLDTPASVALDKATAEEKKPDEEEEVCDAVYHTICIQLTVLHFRTLRHRLHLLKSRH